MKTLLSALLLTVFLAFSACGQPSVHDRNNPLWRTTTQDTGFFTKGVKIVGFYLDSAGMDGWIQGQALGLDSTGGRWRIVPIFSPPSSEADSANRAAFAWYSDSARTVPNSSIGVAQLDATATPTFAGVTLNGDLRFNFGEIQTPTLYHTTLKGDVLVDSGRVRLKTPSGSRTYTLATVNTAFNPVFYIPGIQTGMFTMQDSGSFADGSTAYFLNGRLKEVPIGTENYVWKITGGVPAWRVDSTGGGSGEVNLLDDMPGAGIGLAGTKSGVTLRIKRLKGTTNQVTVTNNTDSVTFSLPQSIGTSSTPTFGGMTLNGNLTVTGSGITVTGNSQFNQNLTINGITTLVQETKESAGKFAAFTAHTSTSVALSTAYQYILAQGTSATQTFTLPAANSASAIGGQLFTIVKGDLSTQNVVLARGGSDLINGATSVTLTNTYDYVSVFSDGGNDWYIVRARVAGVVQ